MLSFLLGQPKEAPVTASPDNYASFCLRTWVAGVGLSPSQGDSYAWPLIALQSIGEVTIQVISNNAVLYMLSYVRVIRMSLMF